VQVCDSTRTILLWGFHMEKRPNYYYFGRSPSSYLTTICIYSMHACCCCCICRCDAGEVKDVSVGGSHTHPVRSVGSSVSSWLPLLLGGGTLKLSMSSKNERSCCCAEMIAGKKGSQRRFHAMASKVLSCVCVCAFFSLPRCAVLIGSEASWISIRAHYSQKSASQPADRLDDRVPTTTTHEQPPVKSIDTYIDMYDVMPNLVSRYRTRERARKGESYNMALGTACV
jgi:hypothetical protein